MDKTQPQHKVAYLSDTHLFFGGYGKSRTRETLRALFDACDHNDVVVLNGDIFEVPFSYLGFARTTGRVMSVLEYTLRCFPQTQINYTIGNHDCDPVFVLKMKELAKKYSNFQVNENELVLGNIVSTHGDLVEENTTEHKVPFFTFFKGLTIPAQFSLTWIEAIIPKWIQHWGDKNAAQRIPLDQWVKQVAYYFKEHEPEQYAKTTTFVLGHTHLAADVCYDGKEFFNTGVAFDHRHCQSIILNIDDDAYREYCARGKDQAPVLNPKYADKRACRVVNEVDNEYKARAEAVAALTAGLETKIACEKHIQSAEYIDQVIAISHLYKKRASAFVHQ